MYAPCDRNESPVTTPFDVPVIADPRWQMAYGERFALEGLLSQISPRLSIETGTAEGGSLRRIAAHSEEVHAFDIVPEVAELGREIANATFHIGDSAVLLPNVLSDFAQAARHVDFALIDGDHSREGVKRDTMALVDSDACRTTAIVFHDTANDDVRAGLEDLDLASHSKVALCMLDFVPGYLVVADHDVYGHAAWNGLGLIILGPHDTSEKAIVMDDRYSIARVYQEVRRVFETPAAAEPTAVEAPSEPRSRRLAIAAAAGALLGGLATAAAGHLRRRS
jgi:cephalosporin hydroxylase